MSDFETLKNTQAKKQSKSWDKLNNNSATINDYVFLKEENDLNLSSIKNSTLSLHIAAYENSNETLVDSDFVENEDFEKKSLIKKLNIANPRLIGSSSIIQNPFEFPRQLENEETRIPEVAQFKASQKLLNPNMDGNFMGQVRAVTDELKKLTGTTVSQRYVLAEMFNCGGFGAIYRAKDVLNGSELIAKIEQSDSIMAHNEANILNELNNVFLKKNAVVQEPIAKLYWFDVTKEFTILLMEPLGPTVRDLKKSLAVDRFSLLTSLWVAYKMIESIKFVHQNCFIHGDVKPSNFCIGYGMRSRQMFVIDFGVARKSNPSQKPFELRKTSFIGTVRYASLMSQQGIDDGKLGDLWSIYFSTIENILGQLPWRFEENRSKIMEQKQKLQDLAISKLIVHHPWFSHHPLGPPPSILHFLHILQTDGSAGENIDFSSLSGALNYDLNMLGIEHRLLDWEGKFCDVHLSQYWNNPYFNKSE
uniref:Protein kinase domain-containing protein n=1 Tax=Panagrolaimus sp. ES5 TaxID=591445 RepID=A0AC34FU64_9BILA